MATFFELLDLNPWRQELVDEAAFLRMIDAEPQACRRKYKFDAFDDDLLHPLHMICALGATVDAVKACYKAYPEALDHNHSTLGGPLHYACAFGATVDVVLYLAKKDSDALEKTNKEGKTPLHLACQSHAQQSDVVSLIRCLIEPRLLCVKAFELTLSVPCKR